MAINGDIHFDLASLQAGYRRGDFEPDEVIALVLERISKHSDNPIWIEVLSEERLKAFTLMLKGKDPHDLPLFGIPFAIKDNIDLAGVTTTAGCPDYAYTPSQHAFVVKRLVDAGAIPIGKTNLDQFATGLVGTRSPYGAVQNAFDPQYISGGSSSGSAVAVALDLVTFSLGTDTAGSGRVPASFNNLIGLKPTRGALSCSGVVPACRSLDCVSIFSLNAQDAAEIFQIAQGFDAQDAYSRRPAKGQKLIRRFGVPRGDQLEFFGNTEGLHLYQESIKNLEKEGLERITIDFEPFIEAARLLYEGPWVAERYAAVGKFIDENPGAALPVTSKIIGGGKDHNAVTAFESSYRLKELQRRAERIWSQVEMIITPTTGTIYTIDEVHADPVQLNSNLGYYTNFMNLLDLSALAVPAGFLPNQLPFGVTLIAQAFQDTALLRIGAKLHGQSGLRMGATGAPVPPALFPPGAPVPTTRVAVCGAHMSELPLNHQLTDRGAKLRSLSQTADCYRFYALPGGPPHRPGLVRVDDGGGAIDLEIWEIPLQHFGSFVAGIPEPLGIGTIELSDGSKVQGFLCEAAATKEAQEITELGSWRKYLETLS